MSRAENLCFHGENLSKQVQVVVAAAGAADEGYFEIGTKSLCRHKSAP